MKIKSPLLDKMRAAFKAVVEHFGPEKVKAHYASMTRGRMLWDIWHIASHNLMYDDTHPGFAQGHWARIHPHEPGFNIYKMDPTIKDTHIETALNLIAKELGL